MAKRSRLSRKGSRDLFKATASRTHKMNTNNYNFKPMRGGTRL